MLTVTDFPAHVLFIKKDTIAYNTLINAYCKSKKIDALSDAKRLLDQIQNPTTKSMAQPDVRTYNMILGAIARREGADRAEKFLNDMQTRYDTGLVRFTPNSVSYTTCIDAYTNQGAVSDALRILEMMENSYKAGNKDAKPTQRSYTSVINGLSKSGYNKKLIVFDYP